MNNQTNHFGDVPTGENISYKELLFYLEQGREIEFVYQEKEYFISNSSEGRALWIGRTRISKFFTEREKDIAEFTKINGITLADLFKQNKVRVATIF